MSKVIDQNTIDNTKMFLDFGGDAKTVLASVLNNSMATPEFVNTFYSKLTPDVFTKSYKLSAKMADEYPRLFNEEMYLKYVTGAPEEEEETDPNQQPQQQNPFLAMMGMMNGANVKELPIMHLTMLERYKDKIPEENLEQLTMIAVRNANEDEFKEMESVCSLLGISDECDKLIYMKVKDEETVNSFVLLKSLEEHGNPSFETFRHMSDEMRDSLLGTNVEIEVLLKAFASTSSMVWKENKIKEIENKELQLKTTNSSYDSLIGSLVKAMPEDMLVRFISATYPSAKNLYNQKTLSFILKEKSLSEDELIQLIPEFRNAGMFIQMRKYAKDESLNKFSVELERSLHE